MRILSLYLHNINSLKGRWLIDFQHPDYGLNGLFAITGPTGAGKSSILDAICLALYGQTPRIESINKTKNDVMTRGESRCECRLTFEADGVRYVAAWAQNRAYGRRDGALQHCTVRLMRWNDDTHQWDTLADNLSAVRRQIPQITGLTFDQFTRSVLLAQGSFSLFLKAPEAERADTLEHITGTAVYSDISSRIQQRFAGEKKALDDLKTALNWRVAMTPQERAALQETMARLRQHIDQSNARQAALLHARDWLNDLHRLRNEERTLAEQCEAARTLRERAEPRATRLLRARAAHAIAPVFEQLADKTRQNKEICTQLATFEANLPKQEAELNRLTQCCRAHEKTLSERENDLSRLAELLVRVRALDTTVELAAQQAQTVRRERDAVQKSLEQHRADIATMREQTQRTERTRQEEADWLQRHPLHAACAARREALERDAASLAQQHETCERHRAEATDLNAQRQAQTQAHRDFMPILDGLRRQVLASQHALQENEAQRLALLEGRSRNEWQTHLNALCEQRDGLRERHRELTHHLAAEQALLEAERRAGTLRHTIELSAQERQRVQSERQAIEAHYNDALQWSAVLRFHEERQQLSDGQACPLCGAAHHPYCDAPPVIEPGIQARLDTLAERRTELGEQLERLDRTHHEHVGALHQMDAELTRQRDRLQADAAALCTRWGDTPDALDALLLERFVERIAALHGDITRLTERLAQEAAFTDSARRLQRQVEDLKGKLKAKESESADVKGHCDQLNAKHQLITSQLEAFERTLGEQLAVWNQATQALGFAPAHGVADVRAQMNAIARQAQTFEAHQTQLEHQSHQLERLTLELEHRAEALRQTAERHDTLVHEDAQQAARVASLTAQRHALFGQKDCDKEEAQAKQAKETAAATLHDTRERTRVQDGAVRELRVHVARSRADAERLAQEVDHWRGQWHSALLEKAFDSEHDWQSARMSEASMQAEHEALQQLQQDEQTARSRLEATRQALQQQESRCVTKNSLDDVNRELESSNREIQENNEKFGSLSAQLNADDEILKEQAVIEERMKTQREITQRWSLLNDLIGSADGKKYRTFVQGLTFDTLIAYANQALERLSRRYLLVRNAPGNLELDVIDRDMAGIKRSCKNLSGGESFIVSLALALGLSRMASRNVRIDSLFLDEGFGSLDENSLENALSALSQLNQERKLIGIISHVGRIHERLPVRIEVRPSHSGASTLSGPGVGQSADTDA